VLCVTKAFLAFQSGAGANDLITPRNLNWDFPGIAAGGQMVSLRLAAGKRAYDAGFAPPVLLRGCHEAATEIIDLGDTEGTLCSLSLAALRGDIIGRMAVLIIRPARA